MARLPVVAASDLIKALEKEGFRFVRQRGSHIVLQKRLPDSSITVVIPNHKEIAPGTLRSILKRVGLNVDQLVKLLSVFAGFVIRYW